MYACTEEGYLQDFNAWQPEFAEQVASELNISLTEAHWQVINALRSFYQQFERSPNMRLMVKALKQQAPEYASSMKLMMLFGESPAKPACRLAGLPKPKNCL
ncbi:TusE/DsrC/DsvC family sulfur relay protein [Salinibius halmophilus]|uniref:TusE/DsrC/DsvC family sulfur relay protein n=1 Tax=Salinibius halmophilus TaxID=1853216 RepID=UPI000E66219C|nr:TusE/DsrC/DsvC family sulfur relay protein [Salinibius halmophilus]